MANDQDRNPIAVVAKTVAPRARSSGYPEPFLSRVSGRAKRSLSDIFGLSNFGVNRTTLQPGAQSALLHRHSRQDEFVYALLGNPTLITETEEIELCPGMCAGFPAGGLAHHLVNRTGEEAVFLEIGDRTPGDEGSYPQDDLKAAQNSKGKWVFTRKDGNPY